MVRRQRHAPHPENHERWLVSYADFITLLFAFFVVMFASSQSDKGRAKQVAESVQSALSHGASSSRPKVSRILGGTIDDTGQGNAMMRGPGGAKQAAKDQKEPVVELLPSMQRLSTELDNEIKAGKLELNLEPRGLVISLKEAAFFHSGDDEVDPKSYSVLESLSAVLRSVSNEIRLEGHTDSIPIHTQRFRNNWELSAARGIAMLDVLTRKFGVPERRLAVAGYADRAPIDSNYTPEGRARNRRVDIVLLSTIGLRPESANAHGTPAETGSIVKQ